MAGVSLEAQSLAQDPLCVWKDWGDGERWPYCDACQNWMSWSHAICRRHVNKLRAHGYDVLAAAAGAADTASQGAGDERAAHGHAAQTAGAGCSAAPAAGAGYTAAQAAGAGGRARGAGSVETYSFSPSRSSVGSVVELIDVGVQTDPWQWPMPSQWQENSWQWRDRWQWPTMEPESVQDGIHSQSSVDRHKQWPGW